MEIIETETNGLVWNRIVTREPILTQLLDQCCSLAWLGEFLAVKGHVQFSELQ